MVFDNWIGMYLKLDEYLLCYTTKGCPEYQITNENFVNMAIK